MDDEERLGPPPLYRLLCRGRLYGQAEGLARAIARAERHIREGLDGCPDAARPEAVVMWRHGVEPGWSAAWNRERLDHHVLEEEEFPC